jgi:hypothetical protein
MNLAALVDVQLSILAPIPYKVACSVLLNLTSCPLFLLCDASYFKPWRLSVVDVSKTKESFYGICRLSRAWHSKFGSAEQSLELCLRRQESVYRGPLQQVQTVRLTQPFTTSALCRSDGESCQTSDNIDMPCIASLAQHRQQCVELLHMEHTSFARNTKLLNLLAVWLCGPSLIA